MLQFCLGQAIFCLDWLDYSITHINKILLIQHPSRYPLYIHLQVCQYKNSFRYSIDTEQLHQCQLCAMRIEELSKITQRSHWSTDMRVWRTSLWQTIFWPIIAGIIIYRIPLDVEWMDNTYAYVITLTQNEAIGGGGTFPITCSSCAHRLVLG